MSRPASILRLFVAGAALTAACTDGPTAPNAAGAPRQSQPQVPAVTPPAESPAPVSLNLAGIGFLTEYTTPIDAGTKFYTTFMGANGQIAEPGSKCCQILADTILQVGIAGVPVVGSHSLEVQRLIVGGADFRLYGGDNVLLMIKEKDGLVMRFYIPVKPSSLDIRSYTPATAQRDGWVSGHVSFEALELVQERADFLSPMFIRQLDGTATVTADFAMPVRYRFSAIGTGAGGQ
jgi:hypothetical protein